SHWRPGDARRRCDYRCSGHVGRAFHPGNALHRRCRLTAARPGARCPVGASASAGARRPLAINLRERLRDFGFDALRYESTLRLTPGLEASRTMGCQPSLSKMKLRVFASPFTSTTYCTDQSTDDTSTRIGWSLVNVNVNGPRP